MSGRKIIIVRDYKADCAAWRRDFMVEQKYRSKIEKKLNDEISRLKIRLQLAERELAEAQKVITWVACAGLYSDKPAERVEASELRAKASEYLIRHTLAPSDRLESEAPAAKEPKDDAEFLKELRRDGYIHFSKDRVELDGEFTKEELSRIAALIEKKGGV